MLSASSRAGGRRDTIEAAQVAAVGCRRSRAQLTNSSRSTGHAPTHQTSYRRKSVHIASRRRRRIIINSVILKACVVVCVCVCVCVREREMSERR